MKENMQDRIMQLTLHLLSEACGTQCRRIGLVNVSLDHLYASVGEAALGIGPAVPHLRKAVRLKVDATQPTN